MRINGIFVCRVLVFVYVFGHEIVVGLKKLQTFCRENTLDSPLLIVIPSSFILVEWFERIGKKEELLSF
jgi:hypothetical protein